MPQLSCEDGVISNYFYHGIKDAYSVISCSDLWTANAHCSQPEIYTWWVFPTKIIKKDTKRKETEHRRVMNQEDVNIPSAENLSMAWVRVRKFPVDLDIWWIQKQLLIARIFEVWPPTLDPYKAKWMRFCYTLPVIAMLISNKQSNSRP